MIENDTRDVYHLLVLFRRGCANVRGIIDLLSK